jgi:predicted metal-dependent hydrolase
MIEYQVLRSQRKTLSLQVKHGQVFVRAPFHVDEKYISSFVHKKDAWLKAKIAQQNQTLDFCCDFTQGSKLFLLGQLVTLDIKFTRPGGKPDTYISERMDGQQNLTIVLPTRLQRKSLDKPQLALMVKKQIETYFKVQAQQVILPKVVWYSKLTNLSPTSIKIRQYRARWGSCNSHGGLSFNYLLMMLPNHVIDYVVVHELCHLKHLNHSILFWQLVAKYFPDYVEAKAWVKANQSALYWHLPK